MIQISVHSSAAFYMNYTANHHVISFLLVHECHLRHPLSFPTALEQTENISREPGKEWEIEAPDLSHRELAFFRVSTFMWKVWSEKDSRNLISPPVWWIGNMHSKFAVGLLFSSFFFDAINVLRSLTELTVTIKLERQRPLSDGYIFLLNLWLTWIMVI